MSYRRQWHINKDGSGITSKWESVRSLWRSRSTSIGKHAVSLSRVSLRLKKGLFFRGFYFNMYYNRMYKECIPYKLYQLTKWFYFSYRVTNIDKMPLYKYLSLRIIHFMQIIHIWYLTKTKIDSILKMYYSLADAH